MFLSFVTDSSGSNYGPVVGGVVGGIIIVILVIAGVILFIKRHRLQSHSAFTNVLYKNTAQEVSIDSQRQRLDTADQLSMP